MATYVSSLVPSMTRWCYAGWVLVLGMAWLVLTGVLTAHPSGNFWDVIVPLAANVACWLALSRPRAKATRTPWLLLTAVPAAVGLYWWVALATAFTQPEEHPAWIFPVWMLCGLVWLSWPLATLYYCLAPPRAR